MDQDSRAELRRLQARAYGPGGDIHDDPEAVRRLEELQATGAVDVASPAIPPGAVPSATGPFDSGLFETGPIDTGPIESQLSGLDPADGRASVESSVAPTGPGDADGTPAGHSPWRRWMPWAWLASVVAVAAIAGIWTVTTMVAVFTPIETGGGARQVAVIEVDPAFVAPGFFGTGDFELTGFRDFHGLTLIASTGEWFGAGLEDVCLMLIRTDAIDPDSENMDGPFYSDCSAGGFPASIELPLTMDLPADLQTEFRDATAVKFVLDGDRIGVFTDGD